MAQLKSIVYSPDDGTPDPEDRYFRVPLIQAALTVEGGIRGDRKGRHPDRQLNVMGTPAMAQLAAQGYKTGPGQMGEQLVLDGLDVDALAPGDQIQIGEAAVIELIKARSGCDRFEHIQTLPRAGTHLGYMARVTAAGDIRVGDPVAVVRQAEALPAD
jgi:MOSC domain-containing protein YiiM